MSNAPDERSVPDGADDITPDHEGRTANEERPDPDVPGAGVDDRDAPEVPEPNEPA